MPWKDVSLMSQRYEFVMLARREGSNVSELCRGFGISRKTAYKWLARYVQEGESGLCDRSRTPHDSPTATPQEMVANVLRLRDAHPAWGGRKLHARLAALGGDPPAPSTITKILRRNGRLDPAECEKREPWQRFEHSVPNALWQMDFKGHFPLSRGGRCYPLTIVDDHSRYAICVRACADEKRSTVQDALVNAFRTYGMPERMLMDNGACWGGHNEGIFYTAFTAWLIRLGVGISHGRVYHPQTQGKNERFNRTLKTEVISTRVFQDLPHCQSHFDNWRSIYNLERPHEALQMKPPISRYRHSFRQFPESLPPIEYPSGDTVRKVYVNATASFKGKIFNIGKAFIGKPVAFRATKDDAIFDVFYCHQRIMQVDVKNNAISRRPKFSPLPPGGGEP